MGVELAEQAASLLDFDVAGPVDPVFLGAPTPTDEPLSLQAHPSAAQAALLAVVAGSSVEVGTRSGIARGPDL